MNLRLARRFAVTGLLWLAAAAGIGVLLRLWPLRDMPAGWQYKFFLHAHSHLMLLGWVFNLLVAGLLATHLRESAAPRFYAVLYWGLQAANLGMLIAFPLQGYAAFSIAFSTLHLLLAGSFAVHYWRRADPALGSVRWVRWGFVWMLLSALGPFALGYLKVSHLETHPAYSLAVYFYLHFQYNGWFIFALLGLAVALAERRDRPSADLPGGKVLALMALSCAAGYSLSALWIRPAAWVYALAFAAAALQAAAALLLVRYLPALAAAFPERAARRLAGLAFCAFLLKVALQLTSAFPAAAAWAYEDRQVVIAYLHLVLIGVVSSFLLAWMDAAGVLNPTEAARAAIGAFILFFMVQELWMGTGAVLLKFRDHALPYGPEVLLVVAIGMAVSVAVAAAAGFRAKTQGTVTTQFKNPRAPLFRAKPPRR